MKKTLLILSVSALALAACSKSNQPSTDSNSASEAEAASQAILATPASNTIAAEPVSQAEAVAPVEGSAQSSLDWNGTYKGVLPCASCEAIETKLTLNQDKTYELSETYKGKDDKPVISKGKFEFGKDGSVITLDAAAEKRQYFIGENHIIALDQEGKVIKGDLAKKYELQKQP